MIGILTLNQGFGALKSPNWEENFEIPGDFYCELDHGHKICLTKSSRNNIYHLNNNDLHRINESGAKHALNYPVNITRLQLPKKTMERIFSESAHSPIRRFLFKIANKISHFDSFQDIFKWLGLHDFPQTSEEYGPNIIPYMEEFREYPMGVSIFDHQNDSKGVSFSCAACHSADLFGVKVLGLTNRFPMANEAFILGKKALSKAPPSLFKLLTGADEAELAIYSNTHQAIKYVGVKEPLSLGLDTSLAQVGLSLAHRFKDEYATKPKKLNSRRNHHIRRRVKNHPLQKIPADSKPAVWWNLKYKTRWLSDGSIVSGNPVHTNFLWNEIGRGVELRELERWLIDNKKKVKELTSFVFSTKAPKYNDFFPGEINIEKAKAGQKLFMKTCKGCHGRYEKFWEQQDSWKYSYEKQIQTKHVWYHRKTPVIDVKTDPHRYDGMNYFYRDLNRLKISKTIGAKVVPQKGYVPPPLVGIWARWPYFHNNSAPTLFDVITPDYKRPKTYIAVEAKDPNKDFDKIKNGYPAPELIKPEFRNNKKYFFDTTIRGLSNMGHTKMLLDENGNERFTFEEKLELIEFLKTL